MSLTAQNQGPTDRFEAAKKSLLEDPAVKRGQISWSFRDVQTGQELDAYEQKKMMIPASTQKVFTTAIAINSLEISYVFQTKFAVSGRIKRGKLIGDLIFRGGGDPSFGSGIAGALSGDSVLFKIGKMLQDSGITKINGNIIVDPFIWPYDHSVIPRNWTWEDIGNYYGAGAWGLNWRSNEFNIRFTAGKNYNDTSRAEILSTWANYLKLESSVKSTTYEKRDIYIYTSPFSERVFADGAQLIGSEPSIERAALPNPPRAFGLELKDYLASIGIEQHGDLKIQSSQASPASTWMVFNSPPLSDLVFETNQKSNNLFAECIARKLSINQIGSADYPTGRMLELKLNEYKPYSDSAMHLVDGCGLSRKNSICTSFQSQFLRSQTKATRFPYFLQSLPKAGEEGTMRNFPKANQLRAKTGSLDKVRAYAGYFFDQNNHWIAFSFIANNIPLSNASLKNKMAELLVSASESKFELPFPFAAPTFYRDTILKFPEIQSFIQDVKDHPNHYFENEEKVDTSISISFRGEPDVENPYLTAIVSAGGEIRRIRYTYRIHAQSRFAERLNESKNTWEMICWGDVFMKR
jgi:D-alanyl-D-alanine carboxypeptidase/D-alanyl-D-alanine-endopeptidase (penicillin-binding protein 4)